MQQGTGVKVHPTVICGADNEMRCPLCRRIPFSANKFGKNGGAPHQAIFSGGPRDTNSMGAEFAGAQGRSHYNVSNVNLWSTNGYLFCLNLFCTVLFFYASYGQKQFRRTLVLESQIRSFLWEQLGFLVLSARQHHSWTRA